MEKQYPALSPLSTGLRGKCPRCGEGKIFAGWITIAPKCEVCQLDFKFADPADGPAFFIVQFMTLVAVGFAWWVDVKFEPPLWVHFVTTLPFALLVSLGPLRPLKGWFIASEFIHKAGEGRLATDQSRPKPVMKDTENS